jgi:hypothetical protein
MGRLLAGAVLLVLMSASAQAWEFVPGDDPLTDQKIAVVLEQERGATAPATLGAKCWHGGNTLLLLNVPGAARPEQTAVAVALRIDRNEKINMVMMKRDIGIGTNFVASAEMYDNVHEVLRQIREAKSRVVVAVRNRMHTFPSSNSAKAVTAFADRCELKLDKS